ncbi:hypothetical protein [Pseudomonas sp. TE21394]
MKFNGFAAMLPGVCSSTAYADEQIVRFGIEAALPPFSFKTAEGVITGLDHDKGNALFLTTDAGKGFALMGPDFIDKDNFGEGVGIATRKGHQFLADKMNNAPAVLRTNGKYEEMQSRYFKFDIYGH